MLKKKLGGRGEKEGLGKKKKEMKERIKKQHTKEVKKLNARNGYNRESEKTGGKPSKTEKRPRKTKR